MKPAQAGLAPLRTPAKRDWRRVLLGKPADLDFATEKAPLGEGGGEFI
jgi:hypothetical protein